MKYFMLLLMVIATAAFTASGQDSMEDAASLPQPAGAAIEKIDDWMQQGNAAEQEGSKTKALQAYEEAARLMRKEIRHSPMDAGLWQKLGLIYQHCNRIDEVLAAYTQAVRLQPANAQYHLDLGMALAQTGALDSAISEILKTVQLNPGNGEHYAILGRMYALHGNKEKAISAYQISLEQNLPEPIAARIRQSLNALLSEDSPVRKENEFEYWIHKVDEWRNAVIKHKPGIRDEAAVTIGSWPVRDLDIVLRTVMGIKSGPKELVETKIDRNVLAKRGAALHADIALLQLETGVNERIEKKTSLTIDGLGSATPSGRHWDFARQLLDYVRPNPSKDAQVRQWYIAIAVHFIKHRHFSYAESHLHHGLKLFPDSPELLLYAGVLHEIFASPKSQNALPPPGMKYRFGLRKRELELAERLLNKARVAAPSSAETHLRYGRVAGLLGKHATAVESLKKAAALSSDPQLKYFASLFLGAELAMLKLNVEARFAYEQAAALYSSAPSPLLAISYLARSSGNTEPANRYIERVFSLSDQNQPPCDPWWNYDIAIDGNAESLTEKAQRQLGEVAQ